MFMMNQTESDIPQVNQPNLDLLKEYTTEWEKLKARGLKLKNEAITTFNKQLWELGMGAIWQILVMAFIMQDIEFYRRKGKENKKLN